MRSKVELLTTIYKIEMRAMVISGGGSKGAFAGGVAQYLIEELNYKYDIFFGNFNRKFVNLSSGVG